jgi:hypothetical protein
VENRNITACAAALFFYLLTRTEKNGNGLAPLLRRVISPRLHYAPFIFARYYFTAAQRIEKEVFMSTTLEIR